MSEHGRSGISDDLRESYLERARSLEGSLRRLADEITDRLPAGAQRLERRRRIVDKIDVLMREVEEALFHDVLPAEDPEIARIHEMSDQLLATKAQIDRLARRSYRDLEDAQLDRRELRAKQRLREIEAETGREG